MTLKQKWLKRKYEKCNKYIYIVTCWANWGVSRARYVGIEDGDPIIIKYDDHNGEYESYYTCPWYLNSTGVTIAYYFHYQEALALVRYLNKADEAFLKNKIKKVEDLNK